MAAMRGNPLIQRSSRQPRLSRRSEIRQGQTNQLVSGYMSYAPMLRQLADIRATNLQEWARFGQQQSYDLQLRNEMVKMGVGADLQRTAADEGMVRQQQMEKYRRDAAEDARKQAEAEFMGSPFGLAGAEFLGHPVANMAELNNGLTLKDLQDAAAAEENKATLSRVALAAMERDEEQMGSMSPQTRAMIEGIEGASDTTVIFVASLARKELAALAEMAHKERMSALATERTLAAAGLRGASAEVRAYQDYTQKLRDNPGSFPLSLQMPDGGPLSPEAWSAAMATMGATGAPAGGLPTDGAVDLSGLRATPSAKAGEVLLGGRVPMRLRPDPGIQQKATPAEEEAVAKALVAAVPGFETRPDADAIFELALQATGRTKSVSPGETVSTFGR